MKGGLSIGIPLTVLQYGVHHHTGVPIEWPVIANNFLVSYAVYDGDRIDGGPFSNERRMTTIATVASSLFYSEYSIPLSLITLILGLFYSDIKPKIAPIKPFFVGTIWTLAIYYFPILFSDPNTRYMNELSHQQHYFCRLVHYHMVQTYMISQKMQNKMYTHRLY